MTDNPEPAQAPASDERPPADPPSADVQDMAMIIRMLCRHVPDDNKIRRKALDYLKRHGMMGSPLRDNVPQPGTLADVLAVAVAVWVCPECDIAGCRHYREALAQAAIGAMVPTGGTLAERIMAILDGDEGFAVAQAWKTGGRTKYDRCIHGWSRSDGCPTCLDAAIRAACSVPDAGTEWPEAMAVQSRPDQVTFTFERPLTDDEFEAVTEIVMGRSVPRPGTTDPSTTTEKE